MRFGANSFGSCRTTFSCFPNRVSWQFFCCGFQEFCVKNKAQLHLRRLNFTISQTKCMNILVFRPFPYKDRFNRSQKSTKPVAGIVMLFTSAKLKEDYMTERLSTSKLSLKLVTPPLLLSIRFPLVTTSNGTILRS